MGMNIGQLMRNILGDAQVTDAKAVELKVGQIVRGVVLQMLSGQDAIVNIGGTPVRAHLELPLQQGQATLLQVQPESANGQIMLKPLSSSTVPVTDESLADILKAFGMKDSGTNRQLVLDMQRSGVPLTKENMQAFTSLMENVPKGASPEQWLQAASTAAQKHLPLTQETVAGLHQQLFGRPMHEQLGHLRQQAEGLLQDPKLPAQTKEQLGQLLRQLDAVQTAGKFVTGGTGANAGVQEAGRATAAGAAAPSAQPPSQTAAGTNAAGNAQPAAPSMSGTASPVTGQAQVSAGAQTTAGAAVQPNPAPAGPGQQQPVSGPAANAGANAAQSPAAGTAVQQQADNQWIPRLLHAIGMDNERQIAAAMDKLGLAQKQTPDHQITANMPDHAAAASRTEEASTRPVLPDSLKSVLLQLQASDDLPTSFKEQVQSSLQQITGQQLLQGGDRSAMFSHVTLFLPITQPDGSQTAAVHIQSRKGKRGELDAGNCRLLFDLRMNAIGDTLVDVQVVNKMVSLSIHNDHPVLAELMDNFRPEMTEGLARIGYQFLSLKCNPFPSPQEQANQASAWSGTAAGAVWGDLAQGKPYKSMDVRV
ncbi:hypothetical protein [Paenibacillus sp. y28]|uniref:hypothetical protein n=1 Tax=Paenibacillus sp. y28 TaxID=3129110 RepID=UPI003016ADE4